MQGPELHQKVLMSVIAAVMVTGIIALNLSVGPTEPQNRPASAPTSTPAPTNSSGPTRTTATVSGEYTQTLLADDESCAEDYEQAVDLGGAEGRSRMLRMSQVGCGVFVPNGTTVQVMDKGWTRSKVVVLDTAQYGRAGLIKNRWLRNFRTD